MSANNYAFRILDGEAFAELERYVSHKRPSVHSTKFSEQTKRRLNSAILRCVKTRELSEAWSDESEDIARRLAENCLDRTLASEILEKPEVRVLFLLYEEGTADLEFLEPGTVDVDQRTEEAIELLSNFVEGAGLPHCLTDQLVAGARRRMKEFAGKKRKPAPCAHLRRFCIEAIDIIREVDPTIEPQGPRIRRFMWQLFFHLPETIRPKSPGAMVGQAKRACRSQERLRGGATPMDRSKKDGNSARPLIFLTNYAEPCEGPK